MSYRRVVDRNQLRGGYCHKTDRDARVLPAPPMRRWNDAVSGEDHLDKLLRDAIPPDRLSVLGRHPDVAHTIKFYREHGSSDDEVLRQAVHSLLDAVGYHANWNVQRAVAGDLRRLECDQRDEKHLETYAQRAGVTPEQARAVLDAFFEGDL